jgi:NTE family protein
MRCLVLSGGAAKGAFQVGALIHLIINLKYSYKNFSGVSVGALNSSFLAQYNDLEQGIFDLRNLWCNIRKENILKRHFPFGRLHGLWKKSLYDSKPLQDLIDTNIDIYKIQQSNNNIDIGSVCLNNGKYSTVNQDNKNFIDHVKASCSFPGLFEPISINDELWLDGGVKSITPLQAAINSGASEIDVILTSPESNNVCFNKGNSIDILKRSIDLMIDSIIESDIRKAQLYNKILEHESIQDKRKVNINIIRPNKVLLNDSFDFSIEKTKNLIDIGYNSARELCQN